MPTDGGRDRVDDATASAPVNGGRSERIEEKGSRSSERIGASGETRDGYLSIAKRANNDTIILAITESLLVFVGLGQLGGFAGGENQVDEDEDEAA